MTLPRFALSLAALLLANGASAAPRADLAPSAAQQSAAKAIRSWGCEPLPGARMEARALPATRLTPRDSKAPMVVMMPAYCAEGKSAPGGGRALLAHQDAQGRVSLSGPFEAFSRVELRADGAISAQGWRPGQASRRDAEALLFRPVNGRLEEAAR